MIARRGVISLCDANYFPGLLMLHRSVQEDWPLPVVAFDIGLTDAQRRQAAGVANLHVLPLPGDPLIAAVRGAFEHAPAMRKRNKRVWPLWICPLLIRHAPFEDVFWMDCDLVVLRRLEKLFGLLEEGPVFTPENYAPNATPNRPELYDLLPIARPFDPREPRINAGVSGWRLTRDQAALDAYVQPVELAIERLDVREAISWHDQGALIWAIQACGLQDRVLETTAYNLSVRNTDFSLQAAPWGEGMLAGARAACPQANILHWNGARAPWLG